MGRCGWWAFVSVALLIGGACSDYIVQGDCDFFERWAGYEDGRYRRCL